MTITKEQLREKFKVEFPRFFSTVNLGEILDFIYPYINSKEEKCQECINSCGYDQHTHCSCPCHQESTLPEKINLLTEKGFDDENWDRLVDNLNSLGSKINEIISYLERFTIEKKGVDKDIKDRAERWIDKNTDLLKRIPLEEKDYKSTKEEFSATSFKPDKPPSPVPEWEEEWDKTVGVGMPEGVKAENKSFIRNLLEREREGVRKIIQKRKNESRYDINLNKDYDRGWNDCITYFERDLSAITSKDNK